MMPCSSHSQRSLISSFGAGAALLLNLLADEARAGNGVHPRTPVEWPEDTPCMTVVDRSQQVSLHVPYTIPYEDTVVTSDEVLTSRRHQFVAFCRDHSRQLPLPPWLTWKDVEDAASKALIDPMAVDDEDVLETSVEWKDCWYRITNDDERREITFAEAMKGVDWDTTELPAGPYIVQGYTWEPPFNIFSSRPGVVHVVDGQDLAQVTPAMAMTSPEDVLFEADTLNFEGCIRALPGSTITGFWSLTTADALDWKVFIDEVAPIGETFKVPFTPPPASVGETIALYLEVKDPVMRTFDAHAPGLVVVLPGIEEPGCDTSGSFLGPSCESDSSGEPTPTSSGMVDDTGMTGNSASDTSSGSGPGLDSNSRGCSCASGNQPPYGWLLLFVPLGMRRRSSRT